MEIINPVFSQLPFLILITFSISLFLTLVFQHFLFFKIRSIQLNLDYTLNKYLKYCRVSDWGKDVLWNKEYDSALNNVIKSPVYFHFVDLKFETDELKLLNDERKKVCKLFILLFFVTIFISILFGHFGYI